MAINKKKSCFFYSLQLSSISKMKKFPLLGNWVSCETISPVRDTGYPVIKYALELTFVVEKCQKFYFNVLLILHGTTLTLNFLFLYILPILVSLVKWQCLWMVFKFTSNGALPWIFQINLKIKKITYWFIQYAKNPVLSP